jgi:hypothetical protein
MNKTFEQLGYNVGDTVRCINRDMGYQMGKTYKLHDRLSEISTDEGYNGHSGKWEIVSRAGSQETPQTAPPEPIYSTWGGMTPEEQGALLLAYHNGETIERLGVGSWYAVTHPCFHLFHLSKYRVKPVDPVVVTHELFGSPAGFDSCQYPWDNHRLSYNTINGEPDCSSVVMTKL